MLLSQYLRKVGLEAVAGTPLAYLMVKWARNDRSVTKNRRTLWPELINN